MRDAGEIARLFRSVGVEASGMDVVYRWPTWERNGGVAVVVARGDELLGVATIHRTSVLHRAQPVGRITACIVDQRLRGAGLGKVLVTACEAATASAGCSWLELADDLGHDDGLEGLADLGHARTGVRLAKPIVPLEVGEVRLSVPSPYAGQLVFLDFLGWVGDDPDAHSRLEIVPCDLQQRPLGGSQIVVLEADADEIEFARYNTEYALSGDGVVRLLAGDAGSAVKADEPNGESSGNRAETQ
ncbi:MAG: GNAT family N-acetyltransferase [Planctomycetes bacterium]|nr:GNAT family N-acetyltransferase [Planctomycetota bacterium]